MVINSYLLHCPNCENEKIVPAPCKGELFCHICGSKLMKIVYVDTRREANIGDG